jgi:hypothetical protein
LGWAGTNIYFQDSTNLVNWSSPTLEYKCPNIPKGYFPYIAREHKALEKNNGKTEYVTYCMPCTNIPNQNIMMIKAVFPQP